MRPLVLDDLLPLEEFAGRRREFFEAHCRYLDRYRRVRLGPRLSLLFENRQTLWFRLQELLRVARLTEPAWVQQELDLYNRLLPGRDRLQAALLIEVADETRLTQELSFCQGLEGEHLRLRIMENSFPSSLVTCRPEDRCLGVAHWVQFVIDQAGQKALADFQRLAYFEVVFPSYRHESVPLTEDVRQSLLEDLQLSQKDSSN
jgi:hypothetical protein